MNWQEIVRNLLTKNDIHEMNEEHEIDEFVFQDKPIQVIHDSMMNINFFDRYHQLL